MAFIIKCKSAVEAENVRLTISDFLTRSRFTIGSMSTEYSRGFQVEIRDIRLKVSKGYCGNHAGPCKVQGGKRRKMSCLEGLDWVSWNDMLNDALDSIHHDGSARSSLCIIRKGKKRRTSYSGYDDTGEWFRDASSHDYIDNCGKEPIQSDYPEGTPGIIGWSVDCVEENVA